MFINYILFLIIQVVLWVVITLLIYVLMKMDNGIVLMIVQSLILIQMIFLLKHLEVILVEVLICYFIGRLNQIKNLGELGVDNFKKMNYLNMFN